MIRQICFFAFAFLWLNVVGAQDIAGVDKGLAGLLAKCAPNVHPTTMAAIVSAESRGHQFAIADAGPLSLPWSKRKAMVRSFYPTTVQAAVAKASELIAAGHTVSLGLAQVNDRNLAKAGLSVETVFEPCANIAAGANILFEGYKRAVKRFGNGPGALRAAISAYNSGDWERGKNDGYVDLVYSQVGKQLALRSDVGASVQNIQRSSLMKTTGQPVKRGFVMSTTEFMIID